MVLADSHRVSRAPWYSGASSESHNHFAYRTFTPYGSAFQHDSAMITICNSPSCRQTTEKKVPLPPMYNACRLIHTLGLGCSPFARRYSGNRFYFLFLQVLRCFSSLRLRPCGLYTIKRRRLPHRKSTDQCMLAAPRSLSQLSTSFIASGAKASTVCP